MAIVSSESDPPEVRRPGPILEFLQQGHFVLLAEPRVTSTPQLGLKFLFFPAPADLCKVSHGVAERLIDVGQDLGFIDELNGKLGEQRVG